MRAPDLLARHRRSLISLVVIGVFAGVLAGFGLPVSLFPTIAFPRIQVNLEAGDRPVDQTEALVTRPLERALSGVMDVESLRSTTSRGSSEIRVAFAWNSDMNLALQRVQTAVAQANAALPPGVTFTIRRMDPTVFPVAAYSLTSDRIGPVALRRYTDLVLTPLLTNVNGVAKVDSLGGGQGEFRVEADPVKLRADGLALSDLITALSGANVLEAGGKLEDHGKLYLTLTDSHLTNPAQIENVVVKTAGGGIVRLGDVAHVRLTGAPIFTRVTADGRDAVTVQIYQQPKSDTVRIVAQIAKVLDRARASAPPGVTFKTWYDQSELITSSAQGLAEAIVIGAILAAGVLLVFLRNIRITLAAMVVVPIVLALTTLALYVLGQSFNIMTLGGMAAAIGLIIDDAIVMIEHIDRRVVHGNDDHLGAMRSAAREFVRPLVGSSAATILIFLPLAFLTGVVGAFFKALSLTMAVALVASFLMAWLIVPIMMERLYGVSHGPAKSPGRFVTGYRRILQNCVARPWSVALPVALLAVGGMLAFATLPSGFMPKMDEGGFILDYVTPPGTSLTESNRLINQVEAVLRATPEVDTYSRRTGGQLGGSLSEPNIGDFFVHLKKFPRRGIEQIMAGVRDQVHAHTPGVEIETAQLIEDVVGDLTSVPQPIELKLYGDNQTQLQAVARQTAKALENVRGVTEIKSGVIIAGDAITVRLDPVRTALEGITAGDASKQLTGLLSGQVATQVLAGPQPIDVRVWIPPEARSRVSDLAGFSLKAPDGHLFALSRIADIELITGQAEIQRDGGRRMDAITARVVGRDLGSAAAEVQRLVSRPGALPAGMTFVMGGLFAQQQEAFLGLAGVFIAALGVITVLLLVLYESWRIVFAIIAMPLLAACAVGGGLWLAGVELNIMALMGMTMVIGIVTEVAIFYFTEFDALIGEGMDEEAALVEAGINRLRPIAMTTLAAILALIPLALGDSMQKPLAIAIIVGLIAQGPLVLLAMPAVFRSLSPAVRR